MDLVDSRPSPHLSESETTASDMIPVGSEWTDVRRLDAVAVENHLRVATLGPRLTSSDFASRYFTGLLQSKYGFCAEVSVYASFEEAGQAVLEGLASALVVANAYSGINTYYMDARFALAAVFIHPTPPYGVAGLGSAKHLQHCRIALHPACVPLLEEMAPRHPSYEPVLVSSTSAAALMVRRQEVELALTNAEAAQEYGLSFVSHTRRIQMVWSLFVRSCTSPETHHGPKEAFASSRQH